MSKTKTDEDREAIEVGTTCGGYDAHAARPFTPLQAPDPVIVRLEDRPDNENYYGPNMSPGSRDFAIVRTKLQEASFFAKRAMALATENHEQPEDQPGMSFLTRGK